MTAMTLKMVKGLPTYDLLHTTIYHNLL